MEHHPRILSKFALDSIPRVRRLAMIELSKYDVLTTAGLAVKLAMPTNSVRRWLEDLVALEIAGREKGSGNEGDRWHIKPHYRDLIRRYEGVKDEGKELTESNAEPTEEQLLADAAEALKEEEAQQQAALENF